LCKFAAIFQYSIVMRKLRILLIMIAVAAVAADACTSLLASRTATGGAPLLWKHRDTGTEHNFIERVDASDSTLAFVALFNGGDSLLAEAWTGMNEAGFAVMNTASYNLAPDTAKVKDREGVVMRLALERCRSVGDFARLLDSLPKPMGVQANFGVMDADGRLAYFETDDHGFTLFDVEADSAGYIIRTNFSVSGNDTDGMGYIRFANASHLVGNHLADGGRLTPRFCVDTLSRSYYHSVFGRDILADTTVHMFVDQDFIPRRSTSASVAISYDGSGNPVMLAALGYPAVAQTMTVTIDNVPEGLRPVAPGFRSPLCDAAVEAKRKIFPMTRGSGSHYIDMDEIRKSLTDTARRHSSSR